ncbi:MAG: NADH-quinone oxidoreductase subunit NuoF [Candidatus Eremiobacterota bacterium]
MKKITVGMGTCGISAGGEKVYSALKDEIKKHNLDAELAETGCIGMCYREVLVELTDGNGSRYIYGEVTPDKINKIIEEHIIRDSPVNEWLVKGPAALPDDSFFQKQRRIVLRNCGLINPNSIEEYMACNGYKAIEKVIREYSPEEVINIVEKSGLRGRGGGGFLTGLKWKFCRQAQGEKKYVICNADEGDPGAFMDRSVLESDPHSVIEGMIICACAIGSDEAYIYVRAEYPKAIERLKKAIKQAEDRGFLGKHIFGSNINFKIKIKEGAGAFVCGEETALIASIEGRRGTPRFRPPFPANKGLWGKPTNINNVETFANIPWIILNGADAFASMGTDNSKGSKVFALAGKIARGGLVEVPMGITIKEIVHEIGGGIKENKKFKAVQMGGPSGGCIPASMEDLQIDYQQINKTGAIMGSGGLVVMDETTCMVDVARFFLNFTQNESCGKCTFCRIGTKRMLEILERITEGKGKEGDIETLLDLGQKIKDNTLCGLGQTAPNPVLTTIKYFREEYEAHIKDKRCPAASCSALLKFTIIPEKCTGCTACSRVCPANAITGEKKKVHAIEQDKCIKCGKCFDTCKFNAVLKQ